MAGRIASKFGKRANDLLQFGNTSVFAEFTQLAMKYHNNLFFILWNFNVILDVFYELLFIILYSIYIFLFTFNIHNAVNLGQGFPNFAAPDFIKQAAATAIQSDINQYSFSFSFPFFFLFFSLSFSFSYLFFFFFFVYPLYSLYYFSYSSSFFAFAFLFRLSHIFQIHTESRPHEIGESFIIIILSSFKSFNWSSLWNCCHCWCHWRYLLKREKEEWKEGRKKINCFWL